MDIIKGWVEKVNAVYDCATRCKLMSLVHKRTLELNQPNYDIAMVGIISKLQSVDDMNKFLAEGV